MTKENKRVLREHAREALSKYSPCMTWLLLDANGDLRIITEPQGQTSYAGNDIVIAMTGGFEKSHGNGVEINPSTGRAFKTQRECIELICNGELK